MSASGRRPIVRWAWRLFRRDWRQQFLVIGLLIFAVAFVLYSTVAVSNALSVNEGEFGHAQTVVSLRVRDAQQLEADVTAIGEVFGKTEVIGHRAVQVPGVSETLDFRAQRPGGVLGAPMLTLRQGRYPAHAGEIAVTDGAAELLRTGLGRTVTFDGEPRGVVGVVQNAADFDDEFALAAVSGFVPTDAAVLTERPFTSGEQLRNAGSFAVKGRGADDTAAAAAITLLVSVVLMLLIALVAAAGFAAVAQRRLRQLGMLAAIGATDKHTRLVMVADGVLVGGIAALAGLVIAGAVWVLTKPGFERLVAHEVPGLGVQWWMIAAAVGLSVATSTAAAWWPARATTRVPVVEALSGRPPQPAALRRSILPAVGLLVVGVVAVGAGVDMNSGEANPFVLIGGALAVVAGVLILAPLAIRAAAVASRRAPIAVRLALRDLSRYQARSGAALAAISLGLGITVTVVVIAAAGEHTASEGNLAPNQMLIRTSRDFIAPERFAQMRTDVEAFTATLTAADVYPLEVGLGEGPRGGPKEEAKPPMSLTRRVAARSFEVIGPLYVASPELLARAGLSDDASVDLYAVQDGSLYIMPTRRDTPAPRVAQYNGPGHTAAPTALLTTAGVARFGLTRAPVGWFVESERGFTSEQVAEARDLAAAVGLFVEVRDTQGGLLATRAIATGVGVFVALCLLALTIGLIRSEAGRDLQTLVASGATSFTRRALTAATSGALALLGSMLAIAGSYLALVAIYLDRPADLGSVPVVELATLLFGLPLLAAGAGWLLTGREPMVITRHVLD